MQDDPFKDIEASYDDLDPQLADERERRRQARQRRIATLKAQVDHDKSWLLNQPQFIRWLLTEFERGDILTPSFHAHEGSRQYLDGFRAFGLAMLEDLESVDPGLMVRLMIERTKTLPQKDNPDERQRQNLNA